MADTTTLALLFTAVALLYGSVGHAGASGYLAIMALAGLEPTRMKPTALALNLVVATLASLNFRRAGVFYPRAVGPLVLTSVPMALLGGSVHPDATWYKPLLALVLVVAALRLVLRRPMPNDGPDRDPRVPLGPALGLGTVIGLLSGLTGTGGGIFLSPVLVAAGWATVRQSAGIAAPFILLNSVAGLVGQVIAGAALPPDLPTLALAAGAGGFVGSWWGATRGSERALGWALAAVLGLAALKLVGAG